MLEVSVRYDCRCPVHEGVVLIKDEFMSLCQKVKKIELAIRHCQGYEDSMQDQFNGTERPYRQDHYSINF